MENSYSKIALLSFALLTLEILPTTQNFAQATFQRAYGNSANNSFSKVIKNGADYYVLGQDALIGTVTRLDADGLHQWTLQPNIACAWNDAVLITGGGGDLLVVGWTLPLDASSQSLIGRVTSTGGGNFAWLRSYGAAGRDGYFRIVENPVPEDPAFPYYIAGFQYQPGGTATQEDLVLLNLDENGGFKWKKVFAGLGIDDEYFRDLESVGSAGDLLLAGNSTSGQIFITDNTGNIFGGAEVPSSPPLVFRDVSGGTGDIYAVATTSANDVHVMKFDQSLILLWDYEITQLTSVSQVWQGQSGDIYVTGRGNFGLDRGVLVKITDSGVPIVNWVKYLNTGTSFTGGSSWPMPNNEIAFTDARVIPGGFGLECAFISVSNLDLNTCAVSEDIVDLQIANPIPDSPLIPTMTNEEVPIGTEITIFQSLDWQQAEVCGNDSCIADFTFQINCGVVTFTDQSSVSNTPSWLWTFPGGTPSSSTAQNPVVTYPGCGAYTVCLTVTGTGAGSSCSDTICHTLTIVDNTPPVALCLGVGVVLDANCMYTVTPGLIDGGSFDNCEIQSMSVSPGILTGCGLFPVTLTVTDWCGNTSTCTTMVQTIEDVPPVIECPPNLTVTATTPPTCSAVVNGLQPINVSDNCSTPIVSYDITGATVDSGPDDASGTIFNQGISTITYTAMDDCGNLDTCSFTVTVNCAPDSCCTDSLAFITAAQNVQTFGTLGDCVLSFQADGLTDCMQITYYWGDASGSSTGPLTGNNVGVSFTYSGSGTYYVCHRIDELNGGDTCWSYTHCDSVLVLCESAGCCPEFSLIQLGHIMPCLDDSSCMGDIVVHTPIGGGITIVACKNSQQTYYVIPNLPGFTYNWSVVGGTLTSLQGNNPGVITWGSGSQGFIQVIISDATGICRDTITQKICLIDAPVAAFTVSPGTTVCTNQAVTFTNTSVGANIYTWNFGDGTSSTSANPPPHSYPIAGIYTVLLTVSNGDGDNLEFQCGCKDTATVVITVLIGTGPTITSGCKEMFCPGDTATYCVSPGCAPYNWTVNGGTIMTIHDSCITVQWNSTVPLTLPAFVSVTTGCGGICGNSATLNVPVLWDNMPISGPTPVCVGATETYSLPSMPGTFYSWTVSGGGGAIVGPNTNTSTISVDWNGPAGIATIICNYNNPYSGCSGSDTLMVEVRKKFNIDGPSSVCAVNSGVYFTSGGSFGSLADWTINPATGYTVGSTTGVSNITVNWTTPGTYTITATANPAIFCNPTSIIHVVVSPAPVINIVGPLVVCPNQLYNYTASSNLSGGNFTWSFVGTGTGTISPYGPNNSNASVNFTGSGPSWTLMATQSVNGCPGSATLSITIEPAPTLPTTPITVCIGGQTVVSVLSGNGPYTWSTSPAASLISGQGTSTATYEIHGNGSITVSNCSGPSNAISVTATSPPTISITSTGSLCAGDLQLCAPANGTYQWFVNSTATTQCIPVTVPGTYTVQVTFPGGCISVATFTVAPVAIPTVSISTGDPLGWCIPATPSVNLQAFTLSTGCSFQWYEVTIGLIGGATNSTYTATSAGMYYVEVTCGGCVATSNTITVAQITCTPTGGNCAGMPNPLGVITASACNPKSFSVSVTGCTGGVVIWNFGDGNSDSGTSPPPHTYANPGAYLVTASIDCNGCLYVVHTNVNVPVVADFNSSVTCGANGSYAITLNNTSQTLGGWNVTSVIWTSSCGTPSGGSGNTYVVNTLSGCSPTVTMVITVTNPATGDVCTDTKIFPFNLQTALLSILGPTTVCKDETYQFNSSMTGPGIVQYEWTVNGTPPVSQDDPLSYAFDGNPTNPVVGLTVTDIFGCTFTASVTLNVVMPRPLTIAPVQICPDCLPPASLSATPVGGFINYQWYQNGTLIIGANSATYQLCQFDASGNYYVTATDTQNNSCEVTSNTVQVVYQPKPVADILGQTVLCVSGNGPYTIPPISNAGGNNTNYTYNWTATGPGAITFSNFQYVANVLVTALGTYQFILTVTDITTGCMAKDTFCVYLFPNPMVIVSGPVGVLCEDTPYTFTASATPAANYIYQWSTGATGPTMTTSQAGYHSVTATNPESGCFGVAYAGYIGPRPSTLLFPVGCDTICDTDTIIPPLALGGIWVSSLYTVQWFISGNPIPFYTGQTLNLAGNIPPLVHGMNNIYIIVTYLGCNDTSNVYSLFIEKCCECKSELSLNHGGFEYPVFCDPHTGFIPSLPCPAGDVIVSGYFGFADPITGEPCEETPVIWELVKPDSSTLGGIATNFTAFIFFKDSVNIPGVYCLTLTTISPDGQDTCVCIVKWYREPCDCCTTLEDFCERLENNVAITVNNALCKATVNIGDLPDCDYLTGINWGDGSFISGPFNPGDMPMHTYAGSGTYIISYAAVEVDTNGFICFEKSISDTITLNCSGCHCGTFSDMFMSWGQGAQAMSCGGSSFFIGCPQPGTSYTFTGLFQCSGNTCADQLIPINWTLIETISGNTYTGVTSASPYFAITLLPTYFFNTGTYTLTLTGQCGGQSCPCEISFANDCPQLCPCEMEDVQTLVDQVNKGFSHVLSTFSCKACFTPIAVSDCETVDWYLTNTGGTPIGTSTGSNTFCYTFPGSGTYTVIMVVTRKKADGTNCETITKSQTVTVNCLNSPVCINPVIDNPTFSEGAVAGGLNSGGMSRGWNGISGDPEVVEGEPGSLDGWTIQLRGNLDTADILSRMQPICLDKGTGIVTGTTVKGSKSNADNREFPSTLRVFLGRGWSFPPSGFKLNECDGIDCYELASIVLPTTDSAEWLQFEIPYDLSDWDVLDTCGGVLVRPFVYVTNALSNDQGGENTYSYAQLDNFCFNGTLVGVDDPSRGQSIRIYPNPNAGEFTVDLSELTVVGTSLRIIGLTGQLLSEQIIENSYPLQNVDASMLPEGMYIIQIMSEGRVTAVSKFVKM